MGFTLPVCGWSVYFHIPVPKSWSEKKKIRMHGQLKLTRPDLTNYTKAFEDGVSRADETNAQMSGLGKFYVNAECGYVEVILNQPLYNPGKLSEFKLLKTH